MQRVLKLLRDLVRLPVIDEIEQDYVNAADTPVEAEARRRAVARGLFRRGAFDL